MVDIKINDVDNLVDVVEFFFKKKIMETLLLLCVCWITGMKNWDCYNWVLHVIIVLFN
jgi:hypothetical protein